MSAFLMIPFRSVPASFTFSESRGARLIIRFASFCHCWAVPGQRATPCAGSGQAPFIYLKEFSVRSASVLAAEGWQLTTRSTATSTRLRFKRTFCFMPNGKSRMWAKFGGLCRLFYWVSRVCLARPKLYDVILFGLFCKIAFALFADQFLIELMEVVLFKVIADLFENFFRHETSPFVCDDSVSQVRVS